MTNTQILSVLRSARQRLTPPKTWTRGVFARDLSGRPVSYNDPRAVCWCAIGAILKELALIPNISSPFVTMSSDIDPILDRVRTEVLHIPLELIDYNDQGSTSQEDILVLLDTAIAQAETPSRR